MATGRVPTTANSPLTAKGDLFTYSTAPARLAVGSNGESLVADSSTSTGLRYTAGNPIPNPTLNAAMQLWQRGTSFTITTPVYTADRWQAGRGSNVAGSTVTRQVTNDTTNLPNIQYCLRFSRDSGNTATNPLYLAQSFESVNSIPFAGKTVTVSFYARKGANFSNTSNLINIVLTTGTGTDQNYLTAGYTGNADVINQNVTLTTTWQRFSYTGNIASTVTELALFISSNPTGTAGAADYFEITGFQIDIGSVALPFRTNGATIQGELAACQRYLPAIAAVAGELFTGQAYTGTQAIVPCIFPVTPRVAPTGITVSSAGAFRLRNNGASKLTVTSMNFSTASNNSCTLDVGVSTGLTAGNASCLFNETGGTILFTGCEL